MLVPPPVYLEQIERDQANELLRAWGHRMGELRRPVYAFEHNVAMFHQGAPVAVAMAGETAREVIGCTGIRRDQAVELMRLCASREHLCRPMLRLWREFVFPDLARVHSRVVAVSYQDEALHSGQIYRFDGWLDIGRGGGGGKDARTGRGGRRMRIWAWPPDAAKALINPLA